MRGTFVNYLLAIVAAALLGTGFVLQQAVAEQAPKVDFLRPRLLLDLLRHRRWLAGVATMVAGQLLSAWVIGHVILSVAEPLLTVLTGHGVVALLTTWPGYLLIAVGLIGFWLMQSAFSAGPLHASLPAITAAEPVTGIALGIVVFGDRLHTSPGLIALQAAGLVALICGVILVARGPALTARLRTPPVPL